MSSALVDPASPRRTRDRLTRIAESLTTPLLPADYLDLFAPLRSGAPLRGRVELVHPETPDAATIVIRPGADWAGHVPGQYVRVGIDVDGVRHWRAYSLTHGPRPDGLISITVKAVPDGVVSNHLVHHSRPGTIVQLEQAAGEFVLPTTPGKLLFVTAGSGITPVIGMLRNLFSVTDHGVVGVTATPVAPPPEAHGISLRREASESFDIVVLHVAPSAPDSIFAEDLRALDQAGAIRLLARYDDEHGVLDVNDLATLVPDLAERTTYACGPAGLLDALAEHHERHGLELFTERFRPATVDAGEGGSVSFADGRSVEADGATPLLVTGEDAGVLMPSGCRMGVCYGCVVPLREGAVRDLRDGTLTRAVPGETGENGVPIQTCINAAAGTCHLDI